MGAHLEYWISLILRYIHLISAIYWIGISFYFNWLEKIIYKPKYLPSNIAQPHGHNTVGEVWTVHNKSLFKISKERFSPLATPNQLNLTGWEAFVTWISGMLMIITTCYQNPTIYYSNNAVSSYHSPIIIILSIILIPSSIYQWICKSFLNKNKTFTNILLFITFSITTYLFSYFLTGKGLFLYMGSILGTIIVSNIYLNINPHHKKLITNLKKKKPPQLSLKYRLFYKHNEYLIIPTILLMLCNHYPAINSTRNTWQSIISISLIGFLLKYSLDREKKFLKYSALTASAFCLAVSVLITYPKVKIKTTPKSQNQSQIQTQETIPLSTVLNIIRAHCISCHSGSPRDPVFISAPRGIMFDTKKQIRKHAQSIKYHVAIKKDMPLANRSTMSDEERRIISMWVDQGARIE